MARMNCADTLNQPQFFERCSRCRISWTLSALMIWKIMLSVDTPFLYLTNNRSVNSYDRSNLKIKHAFNVVYSFMLRFMLYGSEQCFIEIISLH